jgi:hypothetical protein
MQGHRHRRISVSALSLSWRGSMALVRSGAWLATILLLVPAACGNPNNYGPPPTSTSGNTQAAEAGVVKGHVTYGDGRPLQNAFVQMRRNDGFINDVTVRTDSSGNYSERLGAGAYQIGAYVRVPYHGMTYQLGLDPAGGVERFHAEQGYVKNFQLRLHGEITQAPQPGNSQLGYWGMTMAVSWLDTSEKSSSTDVVIPPGIQFELTFKPSGALIDGSLGKTQVFVVEPHGKGMAGAFNAYPDPIKDLPVGAYTVTARFAGAATDALEIMDGFHPGAPMAASILMIVEPDSFGSIMTNPGLYLRTCCIQFQLNVFKRAGSTTAPAETPAATQATPPTAQDTSTPSSAPTAPPTAPPTSPPTAPPTAQPAATPCTGTAQIVTGPDSPQPAGTAVILAASSGTGPALQCPTGAQFQYTVTDPTGGTTIALPYAAGSSTYNWDTTGLAPGVYVWRLEVKDATSPQTDLNAELTYTVT